MRWNPAYFFAFLCLLATEVCIALFLHDKWVRPYLGDVLVVVVLYCLVRSLFEANRFLPLAVFVFAAVIEFGQYFDFVSLLGLQDCRILAVALGSTFDWMDLLCYFCGSVALVVWQRYERRRTASKP